MVVFRLESELFIDKIGQHVQAEKVLQAIVSSNRVVELQLQLVLSLCLPLVVIQEITKRMGTPYYQQEHELARLFIQVAHGIRLLLM